MVRIHLASVKRAHKTLSNLRESAANLRIPSDNLSVDIWSSFNNQRNLASSNVIFSKLAFLASSSFNVRFTVSVLAPKSPSNFGLMVNKSHPANAVISPVINEQRNKNSKFHILPLKYISGKSSSSFFLWYTDTYQHYGTKRPSQQFCSQISCSSCRFVSPKQHLDLHEQQIVSYRYSKHTNQECDPQMAKSM